MPTKPSQSTRVMSRVLASKDETEILEPTPTPFTFAGQTYQIGPMPNRLRLKLATEFSAILTLFETLGKSDLSGLTSGNVGEMLRATDVLAVMPQMLTILLPNATHIVATCTGIDEKIVEDTMPLGKLAQALRLILLAEDFPLLLLSFASMAADFRLPVETAEEA